MSVLVVTVVSSASAAIAAAAAYRSAKSGSATVRELSLLAVTAFVVAIVLTVYVLFWSAALGGNIRELLLPDLLATRPKRTMLTAYALASAGLSVGAVAMFLRLLVRGGKA